MMLHKYVLEFSGPELCRLEAHEVVELLRAGEISPEDLLNAAFKRLEAVEGAVNAMPTQCRDRAFKAIKYIDNASKEHPGWLGGIPIGIKDLTAVAGVRTTFGTISKANYIPRTSDPLVLLLEQRGALVAGKTNTPEMGAGGNTFNDVFGATRNPWDTSLNAGGSSGGAAVSLATGEVWLSHGSDHGGSLRTPAAYNGIVGLRPSPGRAGGGSDEIAFNIEGVQGPMARSVRDCALFLDAMASVNPKSPISYPPPDIPFQESVLRADARVKIAFSPDLNGFFPVEDPILDQLKWALEQVEKNGGTVEYSCPEIQDLEKTYRTLRSRMWATMVRHTPKEERQFFKQTLAENIADGEMLSFDDIADAELARSRIYHHMCVFLEAFDVLALPVVGNMPRPVEQEWVKSVNGTAFCHYMDWLRPAYLATVASLPAISVPVGLSNDGIPVGIQLIGKPRNEADLLAVARVVEMAVGGPLGPIDPNVRHL